MLPAFGVMRSMTVVLSSVRPSQWPEFVYEMLTPAGFEQLNRRYAAFKVARRFPRTVKLSAADFATVFVDSAIADGRWDLVRRAA